MTVDISGVRSLHRVTPRPLWPMLLPGAAGLHLPVAEAAAPPAAAGSTGDPLCQLRPGELDSQRQLC